MTTESTNNRAAAIEMQIKQENDLKEAALMTQLKDVIREVMNKFALEQDCTWKAQSLALREVANEIEKWGTNMDSMMRKTPDMPSFDQHPTTLDTD